MSKHKDKRIQRILGYTKASHKGAVIYFTKQVEDRPVGSLKKRKDCKFTKGQHKFKIIKVYEPSGWSKGFSIMACELCGKKKYGDSGVVDNTPLCERDE